MLKTALLFTLPFWLFGCSLQQLTPIEQSVVLPPQYLEQADQTKARPPMDRWWEVFKDPQLNQLLEQLFADNLQLEEAFARLEQTQAALQVASSTRWPSLGLGGQGSREQVPGFVQDARVYNYRFSAQSSFEIDLWGKLRNRQLAARNLTSASEKQLQTLYLSLSAQLVDLYYFAVEQRAQLVLSDQTISSYRDTLQRVENRYRQGLVPTTDLYQARQSLAGAEANRPAFAKELALAEHSIATLLGNYPVRGTAGNLATLPPLKDQFPTGLPADLLQRRPDIAERFHLLRSADAEVAAAIAERLPSLDLTANYGFLQTDFGIGAITGNFWQLIVQPALPLLDGGRRRSEVARSRAVVRERLAGYRQAVLDAYREVEDALVANQTAEQRIEYLTITAAATTASLRLALQNYLHGINDYLPVLSAQRNDFQIQRELLAARRQLVSARISLSRALGGKWMNQQISQRHSNRREQEKHE